MQQAQPPANEHERLKALHAYQILDTPEEAVYDAFTRLAREIAGTKTSAISFIDEQRQWLKSRSGMTGGNETAREVAFCSHVVADGNRLIVNDASSDERFRDNPFVTEDPHIRFYAGVPLSNPEGMTLGTLCVFDDEPREISERQLASLEELSRVIIGVMEGRRRFMGLFDAAGVDVLTVDPSDHTIAFASRGACNRLQYTLPELCGKPIFDIVPSLTLEEAESIDNSARAGEMTIVEGEFKRRDGTTYPVEVRIDIALENGDERVLIIASDLSQRKAQQTEIALLLRAVNAAGDAILVYRKKTSGELELSYMNDAYAAQTGYTREDAIGRTLQSFRHDMPDDEGMTALRADMTAGVPSQQEIISYRKDGSSYWNQVTVHPIVGPSDEISHWITIERDITDDVMRRAVLAEEHDRLLALTQAARRLFTALDARSLIATTREVVRQLISAHVRVLAANEGRAIEVQELGRPDWSEAFSDELVERALRYQMRVVDESERRATAYAGRYGDAAYVLDLRAGVSQKLRSTDLFVFDLITEYFTVAARNVSLYKELDERRAAVLELSQTKSDLIAMLAHDFRGPLTSIVGFADLTGEVGDVNGEQREFLDTIKRSAMQLSDLATDTLTLSRLERNEVTLHVGSVDLESMLRSIIAAQTEAREITLSVSGDPWVYGDDERLRQVFANLIDNAIKYSPGGTPAGVSLDGGPDSVVVRVADRGIGIPAGDLSRVFDRFSRASNAKKLRIPGTGFGLFLTKQLVQLHSGTIAVESTEGLGSTFVVTLQRRIGRNAGPRTIAIVDAERERSFLAYGLREAGYRVLTAGNFDEVLSVADAQNVDALILACAEDLSNTDAALYRALARERSLPLVAIANEPSAKLNAAMTLMRPVLIGDVVSALEGLTIGAAP